MPEYPERPTDHGQATGKLYHLRLRVKCTLFCNLHAILVIGLYELLGNPTKRECNHTVRKSIHVVTSINWGNLKTLKIILFWGNLKTLKIILFWGNLKTLKIILFWGNLQRTWDKRNNRDNHPCSISWHLPQIWYKWSTFYQTLWQTDDFNFATHW
jgi:hypothetical protein